MAKLMKVALSAIMFGACSTVIYAQDAGTEAALVGGSVNNWGNCTSIGCQKDIPIKLKVNKKCEVLGGSLIELSEKGGSKTSDYTIRSNTHYVLNIQTANAGTSASTYVKHEKDSNVRVPTTISTTKVGGGIIAWGNTQHNGLADDKYTVSVSNQAVGAFQRAGTYTDTYRIKVYY